MHPTQPPAASVMRPLSVAAAAIFLLASALATWMVHRSYLHHVDTATVATRNLAELLLHDIGNDFDSTDKALLVLVEEFEHHAHGGKHDQELINKRIRSQKARHPELAALRIVDAGGEVTHGIDGNKSQPGSSVTDRDYFLRHRNDPNAGLVISRPLKGKISGAWGIMFTRRLNHPDGRFAGVALANLSLAQFENRFSRLSLGPGGSVAMRDTELGIIARYPDTQGRIATGDRTISIDFQLALQNDPAQGTYTSGATSIDGISRVHTYRRHDHYPFYINVGMSQEAFLVTWYAELKVTLAILLLFSLMMAAGIRIVDRSWKRREEALTKLNQSETRQQAIIDVSPIPFAVNNPDGHFTYLNAAFSRTFGYTLDDLKNLDDWWRLAYPDPAYRRTSQEAWQNRIARMQQGERALEPIEAIVQCKDGRQRTVLGDIVPVEDTEKGSSLSVLIDITERKESETLFRDAFQLSPIAGSLSTLMDGRFLQVNDVYANTFGWTTKEMQERTSVEVGMWQDAVTRNEWINELMTRGETHAYPMKLFTRDKRSIDALLYARKINYQGQICVLTLIHDVTEKLEKDAELENYRQNLETMVIERTHELALAMQAAQAASLAKSSFLANMSHEIRTPLNAITGMAHMIRKTGLQPDQLDRLNKLEGASQHLLEIINSILDISKIEAGKFKLEETPLRIETVVHNVVAMLADRARDKKLELSAELPPFSTSWIGDAPRLQQALLNLVANGVKFTEAGSVRIRVMTVKEDSQAATLRFDVIDTGMGIAPESMGRLFRNFEQADNSMTRKFGGSGLGLAITRNIAELMGGEAGAESTPDVGSTFWFTVRLRKCAPVEVEVMPGIEESADVILRRDYPGTRILVVDDDPLNREIAAMMLDDVGCVVDQAVDGQEAVDMATQNNFQLILMDIQMPKMNGIEASLRIKRLPDYRSVPIMAMTANVFSEDRERYLAAGMTGFIPKPTPAATLYTTLLHHLQTSLSN